MLDTVTLIIITFATFLIIISVLVNICLGGPKIIYDREEDASKEFQASRSRQKISFNLNGQRSQGYRVHRPGGGYYYYDETGTFIDDFIDTVVFLEVINCFNNNHSYIDEIANSSVPYEVFPENPRIPDIVNSFSIHGAKEEFPHYEYTENSEPSNTDYE